jgi:ketosteroid isomerase-like protein
MKSAFRACALLVSLAFPLLTACHNAPTPAVSDEAGVRAFLDTFQKAFVTKDVTTVMALYTPDVIAYDVVPPLQYVGGDAYGKDFAGFFKQFQGPINFEFSDVHIQTTGDLAIVESLQHLTGTQSSGEKIDIWFRGTSGLRKVDGKWLDFHDHISAPVDLNTGKAVLDLKP